MKDIGIFLCFVASLLWSVFFFLVTLAPAVSCRDSTTARARTRQLTQRPSLTTSKGGWQGSPPPPLIVCFG